MESAQALRRRADQMVQQGNYAGASAAYRAEAAIYRRNGDTEGAKVEEAKADRWSSAIHLYAELPGYRTAVRKLAKFEPPYGCYVGAFLDRDERLGDGFLADEQRHRDPADFGRLVDKKHASAFCYVKYGRRFPTEWVRVLREARVAPHIAWEPNDGLHAVQDDAYLQSFAQEAGRTGCPIFLRYASEMNGNWTAYGGDPLLYKIKWGIVRNAFARYAPNVAMVWCVNETPERPIMSFYPGDGYVDWVGINLYSVPFYDNDTSRSGLGDNPADRLRYVYRQFAPRKPIAVCEFGASRLTKVDNQDRSGWAGRKIRELYAALPRLYSRVKLIDIFDNDNIKYAEDVARQLNNYSVTDTESVRRAYSQAIRPDYFLSTVGDWDYRPTPIVNIEKGTSVSRGILRVSTWARCYADRYAVIYALDGKSFASVTEPGPRDAVVRLVNTGPHLLSATIRDDRGRIAAHTEAHINVV